MIMDNNERANMLKLEPGLTGSDGGGCISCPVLRKKLQTCREWVKFYHVKLEHQDKLLHIVADYKREKEQKVELQLAYDQRTRESSYMREQMANLLLEIQPLRKKISSLEKDLEDEKKLRQTAENQVLDLRHTIDQQQHKIDSMRAKVDMNLIEVLEKKHKVARSEVKRLRSDLDDKSCEVSELKEFLQDRRDHFLRNQKKTAWSLRLAWKYGSCLMDRGQHPDELTEESSWARLVSLEELMQSQLRLHYQVYRKKEEKNLKKDLVAIAALPSLEAWLNDFDDDQASDYDSFDCKKIKKEQKLVDEAKKLEELLQTEGRTRKVVSQHRQDAEQQNQVAGDINSGLNQFNVEMTADPPVVKEESEINACEIVRQKKHVKTKTKEQNTKKDKSMNHKRQGRRKDDSKEKSHCMEEETIHRKNHGGIESSEEGKQKKTNYQVIEADPISDVYCQSSTCVDSTINVQFPSLDMEVLNNKEANENVDSSARPSKTEIQIDSQKNLVDLDNFSLHVEGMNEGEDPIMAILNDMRPHAKIDCLDNSFAFEDSGLAPVQIDNGNPVDDCHQNSHGLSRVHEDLELLSDSSDDVFDSRPKKLMTQESQGFLIDFCEQNRGPLVSQETLDLKSLDEVVDTKPVKKLLGHNFLSSQGFSFDMDECSTNSEVKDDMEETVAGSSVEIETVGSETEKHVPTDTWDLNLSEDDGQSKSGYSEHNDNIELDNNDPDAIGTVENEEEPVAKKHGTGLGDCTESHNESKEGHCSDVSKYPISISNNCQEETSQMIEQQEEKLGQESMQPRIEIMEHDLGKDQQPQQSLQERTSISIECCVSEVENKNINDTSNDSLSKQQIFDQNLNQQSTSLTLQEDGSFANFVHPKDIKEDMKVCSSTKLRTCSEGNSSDHSWLVSSESENEEDLIHKKDIHPKTLKRKRSISILSVEVDRASETKSEDEGRRNFAEKQIHRTDEGEKMEESKLTANVGMLLEDCSTEENVSNMAEEFHDVTDVKSPKAYIIQENSQSSPNEDNGDKDSITAEEGELKSRDTINAKKMLRSSSSCSDSLDAHSSEGQIVESTTDTSNYKTANQNDCIQNLSESDAEERLCSESRRKKETEQKLECSETSQVHLNENVKSETNSVLTQSAGAGTPKNKTRSMVTRKRSLRITRKDRTSIDSPTSGKTECNGQKSEDKMAHQNVLLTTKDDSVVQTSNEDTDKSVEMTPVPKDEICTELKRDEEAPQCISHSDVSGEIIFSKSDNIALNTNIKISDKVECTVITDTTVTSITPLNSVEKDSITGTSDGSNTINAKNTTTVVDDKETLNIQNQIEQIDNDEIMKQKCNATDKEFNERNKVSISWPIEGDMKEEDKGASSVSAEFEAGSKTKEQIINTNKPGHPVPEARNLDKPKKIVDAGHTSQSKPQTTGVRFSWGKSMLSSQKKPVQRKNVEFILRKKIMNETPSAFDKLKANIFSLEIRNSRKRHIRPSVEEVEYTSLDTGNLDTGNKSDFDNGSVVQQNRESYDVNDVKQGKNLLEEKGRFSRKRTVKQRGKEASSLSNGKAISKQKKSLRTEEPPKSVSKRIKASQHLFSSESSEAEGASASCMRKRRIMRRKRNQTIKPDSDSEEAEIGNEICQKSRGNVSRYGRKLERDQNVDKKSRRIDITSSNAHSRTSSGAMKRQKRNSSSSSYGSIRTSVSESDITSPGRLSVSCKDRGKSTLSNQNSEASTGELQILKNETSSDLEASEIDNGCFKGKKKICTIVSSESEHTDAECKEEEYRKRKRPADVKKSYKNEQNVNIVGQIKSSSSDENISDEKEATKPIKKAKIAKSAVSEHLKSSASLRQDDEKCQKYSSDIQMRKSFLSVDKKSFPTFEQAARIASTLSRNHSESQEKKRTAILLETAPQLGVKRTKKNYILPKKSSEEDVQNKTQSIKMGKRKQTVPYKSQMLCVSSSDDDREHDEKDESLVEKSNSIENQSFTQPSASDPNIKATITPHPGLVSSLAKLGTLDRPRALPKAKTAPPTAVPASTDFIEKLFSAQRSQTSDTISQCQPKYYRVGDAPCEPESNVDCMRTSDNQSAMQVPITHGPSINIQQQRASKLMTSDGLTKEELISPANPSVNDVSDTKEPVRTFEENTAMPCQLTDGAKHKEAHSQITHETERNEDLKCYPPKSTSEPQHEASNRLLSPTIKSPINEDKENELRSVVKELVACNINSKEWRRLLNKLKKLALSAPVPQLVRVFLWCILQQNPLQEKKVTQGLTPALYQLFQVVCVLELRLGLPQEALRTALSNSIRVLLCQSSLHLRPHSLGSLAAWYVASLSASQREDKDTLQLGRAFLVDLLFHHPGTVHLALFSALTSGHKFLIRMVNHREISGIEKVLQWVAFHGIWMGAESVRTQLTNYLTNQIGVHNPPAGDITVLLKDLLSKLADSSELDVSCNLLTGIVILARWQGKAWILSHLLPAARALISQESGDGKEVLVEEAPRQLLDMLTVSFGKLNGIFVADATSADNTKLGCDLQELKSVLTRLVLGSGKCKDET